MRVNMSDESLRKYGKDLIANFFKIIYNIYYIIFNKSQFSKSRGEEIKN